MFPEYGHQPTNGDRYEGEPQAQQVPGGWLVTVQFRAKNGFGGYERTARACVFDARGQVTAIIKT